jgi:glutamate-1-semialdehyde 2,1-aminomutase
MSKNTELFQKAKFLMPGGVNSPVRAFRSVNLEPLFIVSGQGSKIYDIEGREFIDYVGSWGPLILGHAHPEVIETLQEVIRKGTSFGAPTELEVQLAEKIVELIPSVEMVRMVSSGTEATMSAIRLARGFTGRNKIIKFEGCYHGHGDSFLIKAGSGALTFGEPNSPGVPAALAKETLIAEFNNITSVQYLFENFPDQIAAVIVEPVAGNMGVIPPLKGFLSDLRNLCDRYGALLIFDEVMTGFRVHPGGAQSLYQVTPDLTTIGKVMGGGLPAAAYGGKKEIMEKISPVGPIYQAGTLSGNPLAMAAGLKTLEIISRPGFFEELNNKSNWFFEELNLFIEQEDLPLSLNHVNSMGCLFFKKGRVANFKQAIQSNTDLFATYFGLMLQKGIYLAPSQFEAMFISAAHSTKDLNYTLEKTKETLTYLFS